MLWKNLRRESICCGVDFVVSMCPPENAFALRAIYAQAAAWSIRFILHFHCQLFNLSIAL
jgi:hypothetical protein